MKKISMFMSALALLAFASCEENNGGIGDDIIEDGFYVVGQATGSDDIQADYMMAAGFNEVSKSKRDGMYEKYVALEAGKTFSLAIYEAGEITRFGAELADMDLTGLDNNPPIVIQRGALIEGEDAPKMTVDTTGLYHIVLDLNNEKDLNTPLIIVAPAKWGVRGAMNGWGYTPMTASEFNAKTITYTLEDATVESTGGFKFAYAHGWKVNMDDMGNVKAEIGLGNDADENNLDLMPNNLVQYGKDIKIRRGVYDIKLVWTLTGGALGKNFTAEITKVESLPAIDYTNCVMELVGGGIAEQTGSYPDTYWNWGNCLKPANDGKPAVNDKVYIWTWTNVTLANDGWKIRTLNAAASGDVANFDLGADVIDVNKSVAVENPSGDIKTAAGTYNITLTIDADADEKTIVITAAN